jgi:hypothetical protein
MAKRVKTRESEENRTESVPLGNQRAEDNVFGGTQYLGDNEYDGLSQVQLMFNPTQAVVKRFSNPPADPPTSIPLAQIPLPLDLPPAGQPNPSTDPPPLPTGQPPPPTHQNIIPNDRAISEVISFTESAMTSDSHIDMDAMTDQGLKRPLDDTDEIIPPNAVVESVIKNGDTLNTKSKKPKNTTYGTDYKNIILNDDSILYYNKTRQYVRILRRTLGLYRFDADAEKEHSYFDAKEKKAHYKFWIKDSESEESYTSRTTKEAEKYILLGIKRLAAGSLC